MTTIGKLAIRGVRSFHPDRDAVIEFYKPLTLIVGENGAGKTTIIECLKYATCGELPPNARNGQAWLYDPYLTDDSEVKSQVKLQFRTAAGSKVVVTRSLELKKKRTARTAKGLQFRVIDCAIKAISPEGTVTSINQRCADLDKEVPSLMGVSKAVLENVVFCHQEDSLWPLGDSATLKKKFDDIFAATRYSKALEVIRKTAKEHADELKVMRERQETLGVRKQTAQRLRDDNDALQQQIDDVETQQQRGRDHIAALEEERARLRNVCVRHAAVVSEVNELQGSRAVHVQQRDLLLADLGDDVFNDADEELLLLRDEYQAVMARMGEELEGLRSDLDTRTASLANTKEQLAKEVKRHARLEAEAGVHQENLRRVTSRIRAVTDEFPDAEQLLRAANDAEQFVRELRRFAADAKQRCEQLRSQHRAQDQTLAGELEEVRNRAALLTEQGKLKQRQADGQKRQRAQIDSELRSVKVDDAAIAAADAVLAERESQREEAIAAHKAAQQGDSVQRLQQEKHVVELQLRTLTAELTSVMAAAGAHAKLSVARDNARMAQQRVDMARAAVIGDLRDVLPADQAQQLLSADASPEALSAALQQQSRSTAKRQEVAQGKRRIAGQASAVAASGADAAAAQLAVAQREMDGLKAEIEDAVGAEAERVPELLASAEEAERKAADKHKFYDTVGRMYTLFLDNFHQDQRCPTCDRSVEDSDVAGFQERLETKIAEVPEMKSKWRSKVSEQASRVTVLRSMLAKHNRFVELRNSVLPGMQAAVTEAKARLAAAQRDENAAEEELMQVASEQQRISSVRERAEDLLQAMRALAQLRTQVAREEALVAGGSDTRTLDTVTEEQATARGKLDQLAKQLTLAQSQVHAAESAMHEAVATARDAADSARQVRQQRERHDALVKQRRELDVSLAQLEAEASEAEAALQPQQQQISTLAEQRNTARRAAQAREDTALERVAAVSRHLDQVKSAASDVKAYEVGEGQAAFDDSVARKNTLERRLRELDTAVVELRKQVHEAEMRIASQDSKGKTIIDNIRYREELRTIEQIDATIAERAAQAGVDAEAAGEADAKLEQVENDLRSLSEAVATVRGQVSAWQQTINKNNATLNEASYRNVDEEHRQGMIKLKTTELAHADLLKYHAALDRALMKYHALKMAEINKIIKELWQATYRGRDIDTIEIVTDADEVTTSAKRSYNYRVAMRKADVLLDMRGRCSAGQKVLASLLIRLALAETFCISCGILALDEPTTNLDRYNVDSLAEQLASIIANRREQRNFQLIVITHDEDFVSALGRTEHADYYFRVSKDDQRSSLIEKQSIQSLQ